MPPLSDRQLLDLWENGRDRHSLDRALLLFGAALPSEPYERLADLTIAQRDEALLALRCATFGRRLASYIDCAGCGERLQFEFDPASLLGDGSRMPSDGVLEIAQKRFRFPTSRDLVAIAGSRDENEAARQLASICLIDHGEETEFPGELIAELDAAFAHADPMGNIQLDFDCPVCHRSWDEVFDIGEYLWEEVERSSKILLVQVHRLALAYGWNEQEILSLGAARRADYLELVDA